MTPETKLKKMFNDLVKKWKATDPSILYISLSDRYTSGLPDKLLIMYSRSIFIEFKAEDKWLTKIQEHFAKNAVKAGCSYVIVTKHKGQYSYFNYPDKEPKGTIF